MNYKMKIDAFMQYIIKNQNSLNTAASDLNF